MRNKLLIIIVFGLQVTLANHTFAQKIWKFKDSVFSFIIKADSVPYFDNSGYSYKAKTIDIYKIANREKVQTIILPPDNVIESYLDSFRIFKIEDMNFDGYNDIRLLSEFDVHMQSYFYCWLYNKSKGVFERDTNLETIANPEFDKKTKMVEGYERIGFRDEEDKVWKYGSNGQLILIYERDVNADITGDSTIITTKKRVNGKMVEKTVTEKFE